MAYQSDTVNKWFRELVIQTIGYWSGHNLAQCQLPAQPIRSPILLFMRLTVLLFLNYYA